MAIIDRFFELVILFVGSCLLEFCVIYPMENSGFKFTLNCASGWEEKGRKDKDVRSTALKSIYSVDSDLEKSSEGGKEPEALDANNVVILYNVNIPIQSIKIIEENGSIREGKARSSASALWDIPIKKENGPFIFSVIICGEQYDWYIPSFQLESLELGLIKHKMSNRVGLLLEQFEESGGNLEYSESYIDWKICTVVNRLFRKRPATI